MKYSTRKKVFASKRKLKGTVVSITENLMAKRMEQLNIRQEKNTVLPMSGPQVVGLPSVLFKCPKENKSNLFYD